MSEYIDDNHCRLCGKQLRGIRYFVEYKPLDKEGVWQCSMRESWNMKFDVCKKCFLKAFPFVDDKY